METWRAEHGSVANIVIVVLIVVVILFVHFGFEFIICFVGFLIVGAPSDVHMRGGSTCWLSWTLQR